MIEIIYARENDNDFTVFFKIDVDGELEPIEFHADIREEEDQQGWLEKKQDYIRFLILQKMYRKDDMWVDWQRFKTGENTNLEAMEAWIADGHRNKIITGYYKNGNPIYSYVIIEKQEWKSTHPSYLKAHEKIDAALINENLKTLLKDVIRG